jgi:hypothetical protein
MHARFLIAALLVASPASAQTNGSSLSELLPSLILQDITLPEPAIDGVSHHAHFSPIESHELSNPAVAIVRSFNRLMRVQLSSFPLASSAGGFTYTFDETLGTLRRGTSSFGPAFAERALTIGRRKLGGGVTYQHTRFDRFEGQDLDSGSIKFYLRHEDCCTAPGAGGGGGGGGGGRGGGPIPEPNGTRLNPAFESDLIEAALSLEATTDTVAFWANYGVTDRWDVGLAVPIVRVALDARVQATILRLATAGEPLLHSFEFGNTAATQETFEQRGTASGLGDVLLRTKYHVAQFAGGGLAGAVDVRLPTGDEHDLLGSGGTQVNVLLIASGARGRFAEHVNIGYTAARGDTSDIGMLAGLAADAPLPDEVRYAAGLEFAAAPRLTLIGEVVGRVLRDAGRLEMTAKSFDFQGSGGVQTARFDEFDPRSGHLNLLYGSVGAKFNPYGDLLFGGSVLFPLTDAGLRTGLTTVVALDYAF